MRTQEWLQVIPQTWIVFQLTPLQKQRPIGVAQIHESDDEVILPNITMAQLIALPAYKKDQLLPENEVLIRSILSGLAPGIAAVY